MKVFKKIKNVIRKYFILIFLGKLKYAKYLGVRIGNDCRVYIEEWGSEPFLISIGDKVTITAGVKFITHDGAAWLMNDSHGRRYLYNPIEIGSHVFIGVNSIIMPGIKISDNVIIAAGSVVTKSIPPGVIVGGVPAKIIGSYDKYKEKALMNFVSDSRLDRNITYEERIKKVIQNDFKPYMKNEESVDSIT